MPPENDDAEAAFRGGGEQGDAQAAYERGGLLARRREFDAAQAAYEHADRHGHAAAATSVGILLESRGERAAAEAAYRRADERGDGLGALRLGLLLAGRGEWKEANQTFARADERGHERSGPDLLTLLRGNGQHAQAATAPAASRSAFANPVLVGAVTVLVLVVAVFLAYTANGGLPFVPTRELKVDVADGSNLVIGNDVREGGFRIGMVSGMAPIELPNGQVGAQLTLKLDQSNGKVPVDSTVSVRPRSVLGLKYVDLEKGTSSKVFTDGGTMPLSQTSVPVQFDDVFKTFDPKTRTAIQSDLVGFGDTLTARGSDLNDTVHSLPSLLGYLRPVAGYLSSPSTELTRFFDDLNGFMGAVAPVASVNADLFGRMATTFGAISRDPHALEQTIARSPSTLDVSTDSARAQQPFLVDLAALGRPLTPASEQLRVALPDINSAVEVGTGTLRRTPVLNAKLQGVMSALKDLALSPGTNVALNGLTDTVSTLNPMVRYLGPFQTVCNDWNYWWTFLSEHISEATSFGFAQRALLNQTNPLQANNVGTQGATAPVNGGGFDSPLGGNEYFHNQNYGAAVDAQGNADCETGQRGYPKKLNYFDPQGRDFATDQHTPGDQGPTFRGRPRVPAGETYARSPQTGPQTPYNPANP